MAALPRKSDPGGAASLPWRTIALPRASWRERDGVVAERCSLGSSRRLTLPGVARCRAGREIRDDHALFSATEN